MRRARVDDAAQVVPLLVEALDHLALQLAGTVDRAAAWPLFNTFFIAANNRYSHRHVLVLDDAGAIAAAILAYPGNEEITLAAPVFALLRQREPRASYTHERESAHDEFYLDALVVASAYRGRGLAARLIEAACARAREAGHHRIGLLVDQAKPGVQRLYERLGFAVDGERWLAGQRHAHMSRVLRD